MAVAVVNVMGVDITLIVTVNGSIAMKLTMFMNMVVTLDNQINMEVVITIE